MRRHLVTFLGRGRKNVGGYEKALYDFGEGHTEETEFFGLALCRHLSGRAERPERILFLGTANSMWDALMRPEESDEPLWTEVARAVEGTGLDDAQMERLNRHLRARQREGMEGIEVVARRIEYGRSEAEQLRILRVLAEEIGDRDEIWIDITHAFRHLPMLGLLAALHLELSRGVRVRAMYYGALEMKQGGRVPVLRLDGLVRFARWIRALAGWEATGDYARFADLLRQDGVHEDLAGGLVRAAFLEQTQQVGQAAGALRGARPLLAKVPVESVSGLFVRDLDTATAWAEEEGLARRQWSLARNAWGRGLYVRATTLGLEAMITEHARGCGVTDPEDYAHRRASQDALNESFHARKNELRAKDLKTPDEGARELIRYEQLRLLRNALVHSARLKKNPWDLQRVVANPALLKVRLDDLLRGDGRDDAPALLAKIAPKIEV